MKPMTKENAVNVEEAVELTTETTTPKAITMDIPTDEVKIGAKDVRVRYGEKEALFGINLDIPASKVTSFIGPSGCGKSTFLRCINRMNDTIDGCSVTGNIEMDGIDILSKKIDTVLLRAKIGMVFQKPNPFPKSIYDNVAYGPRLHGLATSKSDLDEIVETSLEKVGLLKEVKDRLLEPNAPHK